MAFMSGNLCYQIEHHLFPDLPSNRYAEISERVKPLCDKYDLPYTTGSLTHQYMQTLRTILKLFGPEQVPSSYLRRRARNPFGTEIPNPFGRSRELGVDPGTGRRRGLRTALRELQTGEVPIA